MRIATVGAWAVGLLLAACSAPGWDGRVESWGTLREVLREGRKEGKVGLEQVASPAAVGVGALAGLAGEIAVLDGAVWTSRVEDGERAVTGRDGASGDQAALLVLADVPAWSERELDRELDLEGLEALLGALAGSTELSSVDTFPFTIQGRVDALELHVLAGRCPYAEDDTDGAAPLRWSLGTTQATLVGFHTRLPAGVLTHHGSRLHVHAIVEGPVDPGADGGLVGHVDDLRILRGGRLRLPEIRR